jgi:uncharacterized DUF497 family protein
MTDYQWDAQKAALNLKKHKIDFADAVSVLEDDWGLTLKEQFVEGEQRFVTMGVDLFGRVLVVVYTHRGDSIRIISARKATKTERKTYEGKRRI